MGVKKKMSILKEMERTGIKKASWGILREVCSSKRA